MSTHFDFVSVHPIIIYFVDKMNRNLETLQIYGFFTIRLGLTLDSIPCWH